MMRRDVFINQSAYDNLILSLVVTITAAARRFAGKGRKKMGERAWRRESTRAALNSAPRRGECCTTPFLNERVSIKSIIRARASRVRKHPFQLPTASFRAVSTGCVTRDDNARVRRSPRSQDRALRDRDPPEGDIIYSGFCEQSELYHSMAQGREKSNRKLDLPEIFENASLVPRVSYTQKKCIVHPNVKADFEDTELVMRILTPTDSPRCQF